MSNKSMVQSFVQEVLSGGSVAASERYIDPAFVDHQPWPGHPGTPAGFRSGLTEFRTAFPDLHVTVERLVEEGDTVAGLYTLSGTHLGAFMGAPATGKTFRVQALDLVRIRAGRIVEHWGFLDSEGLAAQLGLGS